MKKLKSIEKLMEPYLEPKVTVEWSYDKRRNVITLCCAKCGHFIEHIDSPENVARALENLAKSIRRTEKWRIE